MIEIYLKYDNMHIFGMINALNCINNHVNLCINSMLSIIFYNSLTFLVVVIYLLYVIKKLFVEDLNALRELPLLNIRFKVERKIT